MKRFWTQDCWGLHSANWWRHHWGRTGIVDVGIADTMPEGWRVWLDWYHAALSDGGIQIRTLQADQGEYLAYVRMAARRRRDAQLEDYCWPDSTRSLPSEHVHQPLLRGEAR